MLLPPLQTLLLALACNGPVEDTALPSDLAPLAKNVADWPQGDAEAIVIVGGASDDVDWAHARAYVHGDVDQVWAALQDDDVVIDRRKVESWTVERDTRPEYAESFELSLVVPDVLTVEYDYAWWGDELPDGRLAMRGEKVDGTPFISRMETSVVLEQVAPGVTSLEMVEELEAAQRGFDVLEEYWADFFTDVVATVHGEPLPEYDP